MKKFVVRTFFTFLGVAALAVGLDFYITGNLHKSDARLFQSWNDLFYGNMHCDAVIMGSSRGFVQYSPAILDSVLGTDFYNLSVDGRCIDAEVAKYNTYIHHNPKPKLIIQNVDYGNLLMSNGYEREQFTPYLCDDVLFNEIKDFEEFTIGDKYLPLVRYSGYLEVIKEGLRIPNKLNQYPLYKGYFGRDEKWDGSAFRNVSHVDFSVNPVAVDIFEKYLAKCRKDDVQVVLVFAPIYIGVTEKMDDPQQMFDYYQKFSDKYGCPILNYTYDPISYDTNFFYNATHLNKTGAELFTRKLAHDIDSLQLLKR